MSLKGQTCSQFAASQTTLSKFKGLQKFYPPTIIYLYLSSITTCSSSSTSFCTNHLSITTVQSITRSSRSPIPQYHTQTLLSLQLYSFFFFFNIYIYYICSPVSLHTCVNSPFDQLSTNHVNVAKFHHDNSFRFNP